MTSLDDFGHVEVHVHIARHHASTAKRLDAVFAQHELPEDLTLFYESSPEPTVEIAANCPVSEIPDLLRQVMDELHLAEQINDEGARLGYRLAQAVRRAYENPKYVAVVLNTQV